MKLCTPGQEHMEKHYADLKAKKFFPGLISYMVTGPVCTPGQEHMEKHYADLKAKKILPRPHLIHGHRTRLRHGLGRRYRRPYRTQDARRNHAQRLRARYHPR